MVLPAHLLPGHMPVHYKRLAPVIHRPVSPDGQSVCIGFSVHISVQAEIPDPAGASADILLLDAGMGDHQFSTIQHIVAHQSLQELLHLTAEGIAFPI